MVILVAANAHTTVSSLDNSGMYGSSYRLKSMSPSGFSYSRQRGVANARSTEKARILKLRLRKGGVTNAVSTGDTSSGSVLEKEFEFKPTFDDYLKVMESVKTERKKQQTHKLDSQGVKGDSNEKDVNAVSVERGEKELKLSGSGKSSGERDQIKVFHGDSVSDKASSKLNRLKKFENNRISLERKKEKNKSPRGEDFDAMTENNKISSKMKKERSKSPKGEEFGVMLSKKRIEVERGNEMNVWSSGKLTRGNKGFNTKIDESSLDIQSPAFKFFEESNGVVDNPRISRMEMEERTQKLAKWLNGADIDMPEWMFSKTMRSARIKFSDHSILRVIQLLGKLGNWRRVLQVIEWLQRRERFKSNRLRFIYTTALNVLGKARRPVEALNVFHAMQQQMSSYPDSVAYRSVAVTLGQAGHIKELFDVIDTMRSLPKKKFKTTVLGKWDPRLEPDIVVYNAVLNACVHRKQWEGAFWVLQQLKHQGQKPSASTYGLVMEVMFACGKYNLVHEFFRKMQKSSIPTALAYRVVLNTCWKEGKIDDAVHVVQEMEQRGIVGSAALYYDLARCLCSAGRCQEALALMKKICRVANKPLVVTYTGLIQACLDSGNIQNGAYIFDQMKEFCSPNLVTCNVMLKAYIEHGMFDEAKELFSKMSQDSANIGTKSDFKSRVLPDTFTFNTMLDSCAAEGRWDEFEYIYTQMLHHGYHFNAKRHLRLVLDAGRAGKEQVLETTWVHLCQADRTPPAPLIKERFCAKLQNGDYVSAISSISETGSNEFHAFSRAGWSKLLKENVHRFQDAMLARFTKYVAELIARTDSPNPVLKNLLTSCKELLSDH